MYTEAWYVLRTKAHKEDQVEHYLRSRGIEIYYPTIRVEPVNPRASKIQPYFPCYLFVHVNLAEIGTSLINWAPGSIGLVSFGEQPAVVADTLIAQLRSRIGIVADEPTPAFEKGDQVVIQRGPLEGYEAIFDTTLSGQKRVQVLLYTLGRSVKATVNATDIRKRLAGAS